MSTQDSDVPKFAALTVVFAVVAIVVASVLAFGASHKGSAAKKPATPALAAATAPATPVPTTAEAAQMASDAASVKVENGVVKFYFASGKAELAAGAGEALADVVKQALAGRKLVISGFHDSTGDAAKNAELAKQRAIAVREALKSAGVKEAQIDLKKPEQMTGSGSDAEARRVEVSVQ
ncbi:MAG: OmpA family protein [Pseudomonadota bacterium]